MDELEFIFHNDCMAKFNQRLYSGIFTDENIVSPKKAIKVNGSKYYGYFLEKGKEKFFALSELVERLPFRVMNSVETDYRNDVFKIISKVDPISIPSEKRMEFRKLIDVMPKFRHTNPTHWTLYKIVSTAAYVDRINTRISTDAGFGKDSVIAIIGGLVDSTANLYGATFAKLEYVLTNKLIVLNELGNLKKDELINMQEFLLATGAFFNTYLKRSRKTNTTQEQYDISNLSLLLFYNLPSYYVNKAQEYFDQMFTKAVINRFIPFTFEGQLTTKFETLLDIDYLVEKYESLYKDCIATLNYFRENKVKEIKYNVDRSTIYFPKELMRYSRTFNVILKYISEYSKDQKEFDVLSKELYKCYLKYNTLIEDKTQIDKLVTALEKGAEIEIK